MNDPGRRLCRDSQLRSDGAQAVKAVAKIALAELPNLDDPILPIALYVADGKRLDGTMFTVKESPKRPVLTI